MDIDRPIPQYESASDSEEDSKGQHDTNRDSYPILREGETGEDVVAAIGYAVWVRTGVAGRTVVEVTGELVGGKGAESEILRQVLVQIYSGAMDLGAHDI